jgi:hypothetical protein
MSGFAEQAGAALARIRQLLTAFGGGWHEFGRAV